MRKTMKNNKTKAELVVELVGVDIATLVVASALAAVVIKSIAWLTTNVDWLT